jgi:lipopolysaccharide export system protein LptC
MASVDLSAADARRSVLFARARRHSRLVRRLRWLLPAGAVAGLAAFVAIGWVNSLVEGVSFGPIRLQGTSLTMANPRLTGFDRNRRPYEIVAERARQDIREPRKVELDRLDARLEMEGGGRVRITADTGQYDADAEVFRAHGNVLIASSLGYEMAMEEATVNVRQQTMVTTRPVEGRQGDNRIRSERMEATGGGEVVVFEGNVRVLYHMREEQ